MSYPFEPATAERVAEDGLALYALLLGMGCTVYMFCFDEMFAEFFVFDAFGRRVGSAGYSTWVFMDAYKELTGEEWAV